MEPLRCLFIVQGEGRGHLTQALALRAHLRAAGHAVAGVLVGRPPHRAIPSFFLEKIDAPVTTFESPTFALDARNRGVRVGPTLWHNVSRAPAFRAAFRRIDEAVRRWRPDVLVNFFDPLAGLYARRFRPAAPMVCIGHQYLFRHPEYVFPPGHAVQRRLLRHYVDLTAAGAARRLALSFHPAPDLPEKNLVVMPPLLRPEVFRQPLDRSEPFFLIYVLNSGYAEAVIRLHEWRKDVRLHCFWDRADAPDVLAYDDTLTFHRLDDEKFLSMMARCRGLACTAGFESVCEALYLGKPVLVSPVEGHFEQQCNAREAEACGAGRVGPLFELDRLLDAPMPRREATPHFRAWVRGAGERFVREIEAVARRRPARTCVAA